MFNSNVRKARKLLADKKNVMVFTGAGASAPSGVPTFSGSDAITDWGIHQFRTNKEWREQVWEMAFDTYWNVKPNPAHDAIAKFVKAGRGMHVTSNVDGLLAGLELCGNVRRIRCDSCREEANLDLTRLRWQDGDKDPHCEDCGRGTLRPDVTFIGEAFDGKAMRSFSDGIVGMDALVTVGASGLVGMWIPAYNHAVGNGVPVVSVNKSSVPWDELADVPLRGDAARLVPRLLG